MAQEPKGCQTPKECEGVQSPKRPGNPPGKSPQTTRSASAGLFFEVFSFASGVQAVCCTRNVLVPGGIGAMMCDVCDVKSGCVPNLLEAPGFSTNPRKACGKSTGNPSILLNLPFTQPSFRIGCAEAMQSHPDSGVKVKQGQILPGKGQMARTQHGANCFVDRIPAFHKNICPNLEQMLN